LLRLRSALRCRTLGRSRPRLAGLAPLMGKALVSNIRVPPRFHCRPKALAMARLSVVASPLVILLLSFSQFCPLALLLPPFLSLAGTRLLPIGWHPTATLWLAPYCSSSLAGIPSARWLRLPSTLSDWVSPPWLRLVVVLHCLRGYCPMPWIDVLTCPTVHRSFGGPSRLEFSYVAGHQSSPPWSPFVAVQIFSFVLVSLRKGLGLSTCTFLCIVSLCIWGIFILGARRGGLFLWTQGIGYFL